MTIKPSFYKYIEEKESNWIENINSNLLNVYYLPELKKFYLSLQNHLKNILIIVDDEFLENLFYQIEIIIKKIDVLTSSDKKNNSINIKELNSLFFY